MEILVSDLPGCITITDGERTAVYVPLSEHADDFDSLQAMRREIEMRIKNAKAALEQGPTNGRN